MSLRRAAFLATTAVLFASGAAAAPKPWMNPKLSAWARAGLLEKQLTRDEELSMIHGVLPAIMAKRPEGALQSAGFVPGVPRLGIPALTESDASLGVANAGRAHDDAVALPSGAALAATWDPGAAFAGGAMIGKEARQKGFNVLLAGGMNLVRDPRNGRNFEYVGEDVLLAGVIAGESIRGIQSNHIVSTTKHYALNAQETGRFIADAQIDAAALRQSDLLAFEIAVEKGRPGSAMCAYNKINGVYACENPYTLGALKQDWGWKGWVMSDWGAVHSTEQSIVAGLDQESGEQLDKQVFFGAPLKAALDKDSGLLEARLHDMVRRILWGLIETGALDHPVTAGGLDTAKDAAVAEHASDEALVLLKNDRGLLPIARTAKRILVIGGHADAGVLSGGGSSQVIPEGSTVMKPREAPSWVRGTIFHPSSPLKALQAKLSGAQVSFDPGADPAAAAAAAKDADVAIIFATQWATEGQDVALALPDNQDALIAAVAAANPHTVVVLETGGPVLMPWLDQAGAVVEAWYPGQKGGESIAKLLAGEIDAAGRLPMTFPRSEAELPRPVLPGLATATREGGLPNSSVPGFPIKYVEGADAGYRWYEKSGAKPLFPFGYGLSYTSFAYSGLKAAGGKALTVSFTVRNTGARAGIETAQVYAAPPGGTKRLVGWKKLWLAAGASAQVSVTADPRLLAAFDDASRTKGWNLAAGDYGVWAGASSADLKLSGHAHLAAARLKP
jgi:beta-glucosidase